MSDNAHKDRYEKARAGREFFFPSVSAHVLVGNSEFWRTQAELERLRSCSGSVHRAMHLCGLKDMLIHMCQYVPCDVA